MQTDCCYLIDLDYFFSPILHKTIIYYLYQMANNTEIYH